MTVIVTSRRYRQTNSAQALKATNRFISADPCLYARVSRLDDSVSLDTELDEMDDSIGSWRERQNSHRALGLGLGLGSGLGELQQLMRAEYIEKCFEEAAAEGRGAERRKVAVAVEGRSSLLDRTTQYRRGRSL